MLSALLDGWFGLVRWADEAILEPILMPIVQWEVGFRECLIHSDVGRALLRFVVWPLVEPSLGFGFAVLKEAGPLVNQLPIEARSLLRGVVVFGSKVFNRRIILQPLSEILAAVAITAVDVSEDHVRYGLQARDDVELYFKLGLQVGREPCYGNYLGSGNLTDQHNCFFPQQLTEGFLPDTTHYDNTNSSHRCISRTCAFLSLLSYREDEVIRRCMTQGRMLHGVDYSSVHTLHDTDFCMFVDRNQKWAVCCFRGTEFETLTDWLVSVLVNDLVDFQSANGNAIPHNGQQTRVRDRYFQQMKSACRDHLLSPGNMSPVNMVRRLQAAGTQIYYTGHSLGGGLATLFGSYMGASNHLPAAVISFGSPPMGDANFCAWFNNQIPVSWRFVTGNEFAPMAPPLPYTTGPAAQQKLLHVGRLVDVRNLDDQNPDQRSPVEMVHIVDELSRKGDLASLAFHHNPARTLRLLGARKHGNASVNKHQDTACGHMI